MKQRVNSKLPNNLPQLQNLIKRDPESYKNEFMQQLRYYNSMLDIFKLRPSKNLDDMERLVMFMAQVSHCFPEELSNFAQELMSILREYSTVLVSEMRHTFCKALIMMRKKNLIPPVTLLELFFHLLGCEDRSLRRYLCKNIVVDIKNTNAKNRNLHLNNTLQSFMYDMLKDSRHKAVKMSLDVMIELYTKNVWNDGKTVNVIATALFHKKTKVAVTAMKFFLGRDPDTKDPDEDKSSDDDRPTPKDVAFANKVNKKTSKRKKKLKMASKVMKKKKKTEKAETFNFSGLHLLHDPQDISEKLFRQLESSKERFEVKILLMDLISRLVGIHQLFLFNFYPFIQRFLQPHQREVTKLLLFAAQSAHELVPAEYLAPVRDAIINNFITERNSGEAIAVGINALREICARCPLVMSSDILADIATYRHYKDKNVAMAASSVLQLFRQINPSLLARKQRGRPTIASAEVVSKSYGQVVSRDYLPGAEILKVEGDSDEDENESSEDEESGWIDVAHSSDEETQEAVANEGVEMSVEEKVSKAIAITNSRILTQEEFRKLRVAQLAKEMTGARGKVRGRKRKTVQIDAEDGEDELRDAEMVKLGDIERLHKRSKQDKDSRLAGVKKGREGRAKFGRRKKINPHASVNNQQKQKKKAFMMLRPKLKAKQTKRSFHEKQIALRENLIRKKKLK